MASQTACLRSQRVVDKQCIGQNSCDTLKLQSKRLTYTARGIKRHNSLSTPSFSCNWIGSSKNVKRPEAKSILSSRSSFNKSGRSKKTFLDSPSQHRKLDLRTFCSADVCTLADTFTGASLSISEEKIGVLLLNLGGPETLHDVEPFLFNLFADPDIIRLPRLFRFLQQPLAKLISVSRAPKSKEGYASIGGGSPLRKITNEQANALKRALGVKDISANVYIGMRYWYPFTEEAVRQVFDLLHGNKRIRRDKISKLVVLPLYPQYSISTRNSLREDPHLSSLPVSIIDSWYKRKGYVEAMATLIQQKLSNFSAPEQVTVFFSAHGVPLSYVQDAGDPYKEQMEDCVDLIMRELKSRGIHNPHILAYQSRVGPVQWLKPYTDEVIVELGQKGVESLLAVPVSFVSEHIETLEEMDMEYRELALSSGIKNWARVPTLGCDSAFIADLAEAVIEALPTASTVVSQDLKTESSADLGNRVVNVFLGSIIAFFLVLAPRFLLALRNSMP